MYKYTVLKTWMLLNLIVVTGFQADVHAGSESERVKDNISILQKTKACPGCDLSGAELNRMDLSGADLQGANLTEAKLYLVNFSGANLQKAHLQRANFGGSDLAGADLRGADLQGAELNGAYLEGAKFDGEYVRTKPYEDEDRSEIAAEKDVTETAQAKPPLPLTEDEKMDVNEQKTARDRKEGPSVAEPVKDEEAHDTILVSENLQPSIAAGADMDHKKDLGSASQKESIGSPVSSTDGEHGVGETDTGAPDTTSRAIPPISVASVGVGSQPLPADNQASLTPQMEKSQNGGSGKVIVSDPAAAGESGQEQTVAEKDSKLETPADMEKAMKATVMAPKEISSDKAQNMKRLLDAGKCYRCDLAGVDLSGRNLEKADLEGADLTGSNLENTDLGKAILKGAVLVDANLQKADLRGADLYRADLSGADLTGANMEKAQVDGTVFVGTRGR